MQRSCKPQVEGSNPSVGSLSTPPGYQEDLAHVHEAGFTALAEAAARMVLDLVRPPGRVVDLGCGGGTLLRDLVDAGFDAWGIDLSPAMVDLARRRVPEARVEAGDALRAGLPPCRVVTAVGEVLNYAFAPNDPGAVAALLHRVHDALEPGGVFLFDIATAGRAGDGPTHAERAGRDWRVEARAEEADGWLTRTIDTWRLVDGAWRHHHESHRLRLLEVGWVLERLREARFEAEVLGGYDDFGFQTGWDGFLGRRTGD